MGAAALDAAAACPYARATGLNRSNGAAGGSMQFDLSAVETATMVFVGTLVFGLLLVAFILTAGFLALVLVGVGKLAWFLVSTSLLAVVHGINHGWDRLVHHASTVEVPGDFQGQPSPITGSYPRVS
jgi:hypothetical protein